MSGLSISIRMTGYSTIEGCIRQSLNTPKKLRVCVSEHTIYKQSDNLTKDTHMNKPYKTLHDIKARVTARWNHPNCKFQRGDHAEVSAQVLPREYVGTDGNIRPGRSHVSQIKQRRVSRVGKVIAVSCLENGNIRSNHGHASHLPERMYTRYYIQFSDGVIMGYDSHHLKPAFDWSKRSEYRQA